MVTYGTAVRRGLPRTIGGEPWPASGIAHAVVTPRADVTPLTAAGVAPEGVTPIGASRSEVVETLTVATAAPAGALRRGLPRVPGGEPWPPAGASATVSTTPTPGVPLEHPEHPEQVEPALSQVDATVPVPAGLGHVATAAPSATAGIGTTALRRGLPRMVGAEPWPPAGFAPVRSAHSVPSVPIAVASVQPIPAAAQEPLPVVAAEPVRHGPFTTIQWVGAVIVGGAGLLIILGLVLFAARWFVSLDFMQDFVTTYPGEYHLPEAAPVGLPAWIGWQHFFNVFLMVLIIRSGWQVRTEKRPTAFWSPRRNPTRKISLVLWFHQFIDILWLVNGVIFVVLLFVTGQWMRLVPTSWEVFPNALSAGLQYLSLDWPTENGWVNYNSLQQLAYFATVFLAAPLAAITGVRMSGVWPKNAKTLNRLYPMESARAIHFPVMIYIVLFIIAHVTLVFATGALRNLNHMYAGQDAVNWAGFWIFVASMVVIAAGWIAARPFILVPIARLFGKVSAQ